MVNIKNLISVTFLLLIASKGLAATPGSFTFIVASDPQPWRLDGMPGDKGDPNSSKNQTPWRNVVYPTYESMKSIGASFAMINGDMTEFGRESTWNDTKTAYEKAGMQIFFGLGNHDYQNNLGDCADSISTNKDRCAINSLDHLRMSVLYQSPITVTNFDASPPDKTHKITGSLSYSFNYKGVHFVQLNNYPEYSINKTLIYGCKGCTTYYITNSLSWLDADLAKATADGQKIVLNMHQTGPTENLKKILGKYKIAALFSGHLHKQYFVPSLSDLNNIPQFVSDALFHGGYYKVTVDASGMSVEALQGESGNAVSSGPFTKYRVDWDKGAVVQDHIIPVPVHIRSVSSSLPISADGNNNLIQSTFDENALNQQWFIKPSYSSNGIQEASKGLYIENASSKKCMNVPGNSSDDNIQLIQYPCVNAGNEMFTFKKSDVSSGIQHWEISGTNSQKCISNQNGSVSPGVPVIQWPCNQRPDQKWTITPAKNTLIIKSASSNLPITVNGYNDGDKLTQEKFITKNKNQQWSVEPVKGYSDAFFIKNVQSGKCMNVPGSSNADDTQLIQYHCGSGSWNEIFTFRNVGINPAGELLWEIVPRNDWKCLSNQSGNTSPGIPIIQWSCNQHDDQKWIISAVSN
ncbi:TPA: RICIN domain-containing protein [Serratia marcescens]|nr:RICIN domain-containing protein [Serratia proteamaculans]CAI0915377.1 Ricin-type beta-trefoil lectin domain [Serratia proteamaculans]HEJ7885219.1 ricin-type beta-trefoil lectin domain protein [Serratia liquefaciens]